MKTKRTICLFFLALPVWLLLACAGPVTPEPDRVATRVAEEKAVAATLTAEALASQPSQPTTTATPVSAQTPTTAAEVTGATEPAATPVSIARCSVVSNVLNLRAGPGTVYDPPLAALPAGTELSPVAFSPIGFPDGPWLPGQVGGQTGWVSAGGQFISCNIDPVTLPPPVALPPTPTPLPTFTPLPPTPTPTRPLYAVVPVDGDDGNPALRGSQPGNDGRNILLPGFAPGSVNNPVVFENWLAFRAEVFDTSRGHQDGDGINNVSFTISKDGNIVHERTEQTAAYCVFGGGEPDCDIWDFAQHDYRWPDGQPVENGTHTVAIVIYPQQGDSAQWNWSFDIDLPHQPPPEAANLVVDIVQTGPGTTSGLVSEALVFQVLAYDQAVGSQDGDGIANVDLSILDQNGEVVYERRENNAAYCAFSGGEPDCNVWNFADHNYRWPDNGPPVVEGIYTLQAVAYGRNGGSVRVETQVEIQQE